MIFWYHHGLLILISSSYFDIILVSWYWCYQDILISPWYIDIMMIFWYHHGILIFSYYHDILKSSWNCVACAMREAIRTVHVSLEKTTNKCVPKAWAARQKTTVYISHSIHVCAVREATMAIYKNYVYLLCYKNCVCFARISVNHETNENFVYLSLYERMLHDK